MGSHGAGECFLQAQVFGNIGEEHGDGRGIPLVPELFQIENALENCGALGTSMTGSGSVMFGIFENFDFAATASMSLMQVGYQTFLATNFREEV